MNKIFFAAGLLGLLVGLPIPLADAAGPKVTMVVSESPSPLEKFAADELTAYLQKLFAADVARVTKFAPAAPNQILLGNPRSNRVIASAMAKSWPELSPQGHVVKSISLGSTPLLVVGGGSPAATLWAVYELAQRWGVRPLLYGDVLPATRSEVPLTGFNVQLEPQFTQRSWTLLGNQPTSTASWSLADHQQLLAQLAKLKFNRVRLDVTASPFAAHEPVTDQTALFQGRRFLLAGDTPGRAAFRGAKEFANPDFAGKNSAADQRQAGAALVQGISAAATALGLTVVVATEPSSSATNADTLALSSDGHGILPRIIHRGVEQQLNKLSQAKPAASFTVQATAISDANSTAYFVSRRAFDAQVTATSALTELISTISGDGVADRVIKGFEFVEDANNLLAKNEASFSRATTDLIAKQLATAEPAPAWWKEVQTHYVNAMNEMYRGNNRAREGTRRFTLYHAKRFEFALHYMTCMDAVRAAGVAKKAGDADKQLEQLEKAVEALYSSLNALAEVTRDQSDRAIIAVLNEYAFKPLKQEFERVEQAANQ